MFCKRNVTKKKCLVDQVLIPVSLPGFFYLAKALVIINKQRKYNNIYARNPSFPGFAVQP